MVVPSLPPGTPIEGATLRLDGTGWTVTEIIRQIGDTSGIVTIDLRDSAGGELLVLSGTREALLEAVVKVPCHVEDRDRVTRRLHLSGPARQQPQPDVARPG